MPRVSSPFMDFVFFVVVTHSLYLSMRRPRLAKRLSGVHSAALLALLTPIVTRDLASDTRNKSGHKTRG